MACDFPTEDWLDILQEVPFTYVKWGIEDWLKGTSDMSLEIEGAYKRFLTQLYKWGRPLRDDDAFMAKRMAISLRVWKRVKSVLVEGGKIIVKSGYLTNSRFEKERAERAAAIRAHAEGALAMHARRKGVSSKLGPNLAQTSAKLHRNPDEKPNEINAPDLLSQTYLREEESPIGEESSNEDSAIAAQIAPKPKRKRKQAIPEEYTEDFAEFWKLYPRREGKAKAFESWQKLSLPQKRRAYVALKQQLRILEVKARDSRGNFCPHPATWINQGRFDDEPEPPVTPTGADKPAFRRYEEERAAARESFLLNYE